MAGPTGLEPATSGVTGRRSSQLNYDPANVLASAPPLATKTGPATCPRTPRGPVSPTELRPRDYPCVGPAQDTSGRNRCLFSGRPRPEFARAGPATCPPDGG